MDVSRVSALGFLNLRPVNHRQSLIALPFRIQGWLPQPKGLKVSITVREAPRTLSAMAPFSESLPSRTPGDEKQEPAIDEVQQGRACAAKGPSRERLAGAAPPPTDADGSGAAASGAVEPPAAAAPTGVTPAPFNPLDAVVTAAPTTPAAGSGSGAGAGVAGQPREEPQQQAQQEVQAQQQQQQVALVQPLVPDLTVYLQQNTDIMRKLVEQMGDMRESIGACEHLCCACVVCVHARAFVSCDSVVHAVVGLFVCLAGCAVLGRPCAAPQRPRQMLSSLELVVLPAAARQEQDEMRDTVQQLKVGCSGCAAGWPAVVLKRFGAIPLSLSPAVASSPCLPLWLPHPAVGASC